MPFPYRSSETIAAALTRGDCYDECDDPIVYSLVTNPPLYERVAM
jgi:hypothetical protein